MVGIIGAMEEEVRELIEDMTECEMQERASMKFYKVCFMEKKQLLYRAELER